jgi:thiol-disulfide isomerase/thioredoxin
MKKIFLLGLLLSSLSLTAETLSFKTLNHQTITLENSSGILHFLGEYQGQNILLFLFGRDCPHCRREIPTIKKLAKNKHLKIIGVHAQKDIGDSALKAYVKQVGYPFDVLSFSDDIKLLRLLKRRGLWEGEVPFHAFIDPLGNVDVLSLSDIKARLQ